jgi:chromosome segregation ATPase
MTTAALTEELRLVEDDLARLRKTAADLRRRIGDRDEEPTDAAERSALIEAAEEQEALIDQLEARREHLLRRLGGPTGTDRESHRLRGLQPRVVLSGSENPAP